MTGWFAALCVLTGTVYDGQHHPVAAVKVYLQSTDKKEMSAKTDSSGVYRFSVPEGEYSLRIDGEAATKVTLSHTTKLDLTLQPAFFDDDPKFKSAGVTDYTYQGGHGSGEVFRSSETLAKETAKLAGTGDPGEAEYFNRGTELLNQRSAQKAAEVFRKGVERYPQSVRLLLGLASACYAEEAFDEAARWFYQATDVAPSDPQPYLLLGKVQAKQITEASGYKQRMARFARLQPDNGLANYYYGTTLPDEQAREAFEKALKIDPHLAAAHLRLGIIAAHKEHFAEAIGEYKKAIEADSELSEAHYRLSEAYRLTGDSTKAKEELAIFQRLTH